MTMSDQHLPLMEELYSKIHDERKCVTTKSLSLEMGISRKEAASLLEAVPYYHLEQCEEGKEKELDDIVYDVTRLVWVKKDDGKCGKLRCHTYYSLFLCKHQVMS